VNKIWFVLLTARSISVLCLDTFIVEKLAWVCQPKGNTVSEIGLLFGIRVSKSCIVSGLKVSLKWYMPREEENQAIWFSAKMIFIFALSAWKEL